MEELLVLLLQAVLELLGEVLLECLCYYPFDWPRSRRGRKDTGFGGWIANFFLLGCGLGLAMTWLHPKLLISHAATRIANLVLAPLFSGWLSEQIAKRRSTKDPGVVPRKHFYYAAAFTLGFAAIRFAFGQR